VLQFCEDLLKLNFTFQVSYHSSVVKVPLPSSGDKKPMPSASSPC
jgi:hypothetical protein